MRLPKYATEGASRGAALLDRAFPNWFRKNVVKLTTLDMSETDVCVLAQVSAAVDGVGTYWGGFYLLREKLGRPVSDVRNGFNTGYLRNRSFEALQEAWEGEIRQRRAAAATTHKEGR